MKLDGTPSLSGLKDPANVLPPHFAKFYPNLVEFLELYTSSLYSSRLSSTQLQLLMDDESWWDKKDYPFSSTEERFLTKILDLQKFREHYGTSSNSVNLIEDKSLERSWSGLETLDGFTIETSDDRGPQFEKSNEFHIKSWLVDKGLVEVTDLDKFNVGPDLNLMVKLSKHLFKIRGSMECARIFFEAMYGGTVYVQFPRERVSRLDDNFILDGDNVLRDDYEFDEFTYVVNLVGSQYNQIGDQFVKLWLRAFHAGGFRCIIRVYTEIEWSLVVGDADKFPNLINIWKEFFQGPFTITMRDLP